MLHLYMLGNTSRIYAVEAYSREQAHEMAGDPDMQLDLLYCGSLKTGGAHPRTVIDYVNDNGGGELSVFFEILKRT